MMLPSCTNGGASYTSDEDTLNSLQALLNRSHISGTLSQTALILKLTDDVLLMLYMELDDKVSIVRCLVLDLSSTIIQQLLDRDPYTEGTHFTDEQDKEDLMYSLIHQRVSMFSNLSAKRQAQLAIEEIQLNKKTVRQKLRTLITKEVKLRMGERPKSVQNEVAEMCFKGINFRFKDMATMTRDEELDVTAWLHIFLEVLGVKEVSSAS